MQGARGGSRVALVAMLVAVEVVIVGLAITSLGFGHVSGARENESFVAKPVTPIAAGDSPSISIDDPDSTIDVTTSNDGLVHVQDDTSTDGWSWWSSGRIPQLQVSHSGDTVSIVRPEAHHVEMGFVFFNHHVDVRVPSGAHVSVSQCEGASVSGVHGGLDVHSQDGGIDLSDIAGASVVATSDDGHITATALNPTGSSPSVTLHSNDGHIRASGVFAAHGTYELSSDDGRIDASMAPGSDVTIDPSTDDGQIRVDGNRYDGGSIRVGSGSGSMRLRTADGSIHITTNGVQ
jgi:hypothetical protein